MFWYAVGLFIAFGFGASLADANNYHNNGNYHNNTCNARDKHNINHSDSKTMIKITK